MPPITMPTVRSGQPAMITRYVMSSSLRGSGSAAEMRSRSGVVSRKPSVVPQTSAMSPSA
jgi:hypothetical protein